MLLFTHGGKCGVEHSFPDTTGRCYKIIGVGHKRTVVRIAKSTYDLIFAKNVSSFSVYEEDLLFRPVSDGVKVFLDFLLGSIMEDEDAKIFFAKESLKFYSITLNKTPQIIEKFIQEKPEHTLNKLVNERCEKNLYAYKVGKQKLMTTSYIKDLFDSFEIEIPDERGFMQITIKDTSTVLCAPKIVAYVSPSDENIKCLRNFTDAIDDVVSYEDKDYEIGLLSCLPPEHSDM